MSEIILDDTEVRQLEAVMGYIGSDATYHDALQELLKAFWEREEQSLF